MSGPPLGRCEDCNELVLPGYECEDCWHSVDLLQHAWCCDRAVIVDDSEDPDD